MDRKLADGDKLAFINKASDIAIHAATVTSAPDLLAEIIDKTYTKMIELAERK